LIDTAFLRFATNNARMRNSGWASFANVILEVLGIECGVGSNLEERDDHSISDRSCFAGGFCDRRRRRSGLHAAGSAADYVVTEIGIGDLDAYQKEYLPLAQASKGVWRPPRRRGAKYRCL
jgi:hypothetical protein